MHGEPARPKATHEGQTSTHRDDEDVNTCVALPIHGDLAVLGGTHERVEEFARARGGLLLVTTQQTTTTRPSDAALTLIVRTCEAKAIWASRRITRTTSP